MSAPLDDVTVVEIDNWMAAPSAGAILADLGANVIKVEPLAGDPMRGLSRPIKSDDVSDALKAYDFQFDVDNRGKKSVTVALDQPEGAELVRKLVEKADVFMCNLLAARQAKFGLDPQTLFQVHPGLVHATLTGYGTTGPDAWRPGYDVTAFFGRSGLYDAQREGVDGIVPMARPAQGDHTTGLSMVAAVLAALRQAEKNGRRADRRDFTLRDRRLDTGVRLRRDGNRQNARAAPCAARDARNHSQPLSLRRR